jgi:hypothetical protein
MAWEANNGDPGQGTQYLVPVKGAKRLRYFDIKLGASSVFAMVSAK